MEPAAAAADHDTKGTNPEESHGEDHPAKSTDGGLFSSAKIVAGAAQSAYRHESFDKVKTAGAAEDILTAASKYGKLEEKGYGKYVDQAEGYLQKFRGVEGGHGEEEKSSEGGGFDDYLKKAEGFVSKHEGEEEGEGKKKEEKKEESSEGGGFGDYLKKAEGLVSKYEGEEEGEGKKKEEKKEGNSQGGFGNYFKGF